MSKRQETKLLMEAWERSHKILQDIRDLAEANTFLAYGVIAQGQVIVDMVSARRFEEAIRATASKDTTKRC